MRHSLKEAREWVSGTGLASVTVVMLVLTFMGCVTLGKLLALSVLNVSHL